MATEIHDLPPYENLFSSTAGLPLKSLKNKNWSFKLFAINVKNNSHSPLFTPSTLCWRSRRATRADEDVAGVAAAKRQRCAWGCTIPDQAHKQTEGDTKRVGSTDSGYYVKGLESYYSKIVLSQV